MVTYVADVIACNELEPALFVELFAGGASVALQLLSDGVVERIGLVDCDRRIASFWKSVFWDADWLLDQIDAAPFSLDEWRKHKAIGKASVREEALACLYLNRTSFSGILAERTGPIGGTRAFDVDYFSCRFPRTTLKARIRQIAALNGRVAFVWALDWRAALGRVRHMQVNESLPRSVFYFVDPPFFYKADRLYRHHFTRRQHLALRDTLVSMDRATEPWLLSYDSLPDVRALYGEAQMTTIDRLYTTSRHSHARPMFAEAVVTNLERCPEPNRLKLTEG